MDTQNNCCSPEYNSEDRIKGRRIDSTGWGLFLILTGCILFVPETSLPKGTWLVGIGVILLGTSLYRYLSGIKVSGCSLIIGLITLSMGIRDFYGIEIPIIPILLILIGIKLLYRLIYRKPDDQIEY